MKIDKFPCTQRKLMSIACLWLAHEKTPTQGRRFAGLAAPLGTAVLSALLEKLLDLVHPGLALRTVFGTTRRGQLVELA